MLWACEREVCGEEYWKESPGEAVRAVTEVWLAMKVSRGMPATTPGGLHVSVDGDDVHIRGGRSTISRRRRVIGCTEEIWRRRIRNLTSALHPTKPAAGCVSTKGPPLERAISSLRGRRRVDAVDHSQMPQRARRC
jgi:hypothetical protein